MIQVHQIDDTFAPVCICDICGERITDAASAWAFYPASEPAENSSRVDFIHVHKGDCDTRAANTYGDAGTDELAIHLIHLLHNVGLHGQHLKSLIDRVNQIGM